LLCGLQGVGKTTLAAKLGVHLAKQGKRALLVAADLQRPAAVEQLRLLGQQAHLTVVTPVVGEGPVDVAFRGVAEGRRLASDVVIIDTAGRLHIDTTLMAELVQVRDRVQPHEVLLVLDAMAGQDAATVAQAFAKDLGFDGIVLSRMDGDARGGAALSVRALTDRPIKFVGTGERLEALEPFYPERMASRILGMGDVLSLIERAQQAMGDASTEAMQRRLKDQKALTLEDFLGQMQTLRRMGPLDQVLGMIPGLQGGAARGLQINEADMAHTEAIIRSMTPKERLHPEVIDASRRRRIARGSGTTVQDVNRLLHQFGEVQRMWKSVRQGRMPGMALPLGKKDSKRKKGR